MIMRNLRTPATAVALAVLALRPAAAADAERPAAEADGWHFMVAPYLWAAGLNGDVEVGRVEADVDLDFIDIAKDLSFGGMLYVEARKRRYGIFANMSFVRTEDDANGAIDTDVMTDTAQVAVGGFYRVAEWQWGEGSAGRPLVLAVEPVAGVRWSYLRAEIELDGPGGIDLPQADRAENFFDPIVGLRLASALSENWEALAAADVGGFGVGSDYSWNVQGYLGYRLSVFGAPAVLQVGYRALHQTYEDGGFKWDVTQHGPIIGLMFAFR
jgi:hypothetical protein